VPDFDSRSLWETLMLEGFQAGLAWIIVLRKRDSFRKVFRNFDPKVVSRLGEKEIAKMLENPGIIRSRSQDRGDYWRSTRVSRHGSKAGIKFSDFGWDFVEGRAIAEYKGSRAGKHPAV
jgi:DNA-3-methyladenine glycosylase I